MHPFMYCHTDRHTQNIAGMSCFQHCMDAMYAAMPDGMHCHTKHIALSRTMRANRKTNIHLNSRNYEKEEKPV